MIILGQTGNFDGDDVLDILLGQKQTARFITLKIYKFFVNDQPDLQKIDWLAERFYASNYSISRLMEDIFTSDWFFDEKNVGTKIKSPVELITGIQRMLPMRLVNEEALIVLQRLLGQILFYPPNVAGWPGGKTWIDSSTLMLRMRLPQLINDKDEMNMKPKDDDDQMMGNKNENVAGSAQKPIKGAKAIQASIDWDAYIKYFDKTSREKLVNSMAGVLLQTRTAVDKEIITRYADGSDRHSFIQSATIQIMSTPEYQLC